MLKRLALVPLVLFVMMVVETSCLKSGPVVEASKECKAPADKYNGVYINQCMRNDLYFCCAYAFMLNENRSNEQLCFHVLCQEAQNCSDDWEFLGTQCPAAEEKVDGTKAPSRRKEQSAQADSNLCLPDSGSQT